ncbi:immunoglobulin-like domain-containing protein [Paenibacillus sp. N3.4]|uniref:immunoglobulin-like domain-containing protein n=1 Tax=Paenibacillus sp. N3.4 TaxID=2603222 RepID=UPI0011CB4E24|nr:immunoglobulin-like domain-containing protein [Paenibacillus sp. N3.4]TXK85995.1 hypothetical protein FU659_00635 [Paenibacillus sp. N3.4]
MKIFPRALKFSLAAALIVPNVVALPHVSFAAPSSDTSKHWAKDQIGIWTALDLADGYPDGTFKPDNSVTRAEFMALVNRTFNYTTKADIKFKDVAISDWFYADVAKAQAAGYIEGYEDGSMKPLETISRQEAAVIVSRIKKLPIANLNGTPTTFVDAAQIANWSKAPIQSVVQAGYMNGYPGQLFKPTGLITRAEAIVSLDRAGEVSSQTTVYDKAGVFSDKTLKGNVVVAASGVELKNVEISGNLVVAEDVGEGNVNLSKTNVKGKTVVKGGGAHSIHFNDSAIGQLKVIKPNVRIVTTGSTSVEQTELLTSARLEESNLTGKGFRDVNISTSGNVQLAGAFETIQFTGQSSLELVEGTISTLTVPSSGQGSTLTLGTGAGVDNLTLDGAAKVSGSGSIKKATINVNGVTMDKKPETLTIREGVTATIGNQQVDKSTGNSGGNSGNSGNGGNGGNNGNNGGDGGNPGTGDQVSTAPITAQITVVNHPVGTADTVTVTGLAAGNVVKVYSSSTDATVIGTGTVAVGETSVTVSIQQLGAEAGKVFVSVTSTGKTESTRTSKDYLAEPIVDEVTTAPSANQITVVNHPVGTADTVTVTGLAAGNIVKVYNTSTDATVIGTGTVAVGETSVTVSIPQLGTSAGTVFVSVTSAGKTESARTSKDYMAEPIVDEVTTAPSANQVTVVNNPVGTADTVTVNGLTAGDVVKVYNTSTGGTAVGTGTVATGATNVTVSIPQLGAAAGTVFVSVTSTGKTESARTSKNYIAEPPVDPNARSIADFRGQADNELLTGTIKGTVTSAPYDVTAGKNNFYVQDGTGGILVFNPVTTTPVVIGDEVQITKGKRLTFNGEAELTEGEFIKTNKNAPVTPTIVNLSDLSANQGKVVTVKNVPVISISPKMFIGTSAPGYEVFLTRFGVTTSGIVVGDKVDVTGIVSIFSNNPQLLPRTSSDILKSSGVSDADAVSADKEGINFEDLSAVVSNLDLPSEGASGSLITWVSNNPTVVTNAGVVTRPAKGEPNGQAVLTATIRKGSAIATKDFPVIVLPEILTNVEAVANAKASLALSYNGLENSIILPANGTDGTALTWSLKNSSQSGIVDIATGAVNRYDITSDADVILVATITKGMTSDKKEIMIHVIKGQQMPKVNSVKANQVVVTGTAKAGTTVTVSTGPVVLGTAVADPITGAFSVSIQNQSEGTVLEIIATGTGYTSDAAYVLVVNAGAMTDKEAVDGALAALTDNSIKQLNTSLNDVKTSLNLSSSGLNGTTIVWSSDKPLILGTNGSIKRPVLGSPDAVVTLTATISKNGTQSVKTFEVTVKAQTVALTVVSFNDITVSISKGTAYSLPAKATANMSDGTTDQLDVVWNPSTVDTSVAGTYNFVGSTTGYTATVKLALTITEAPAALTVAQALAAPAGTTVTVEGYVQNVEANKDNPGYGIFLHDKIGENHSTTDFIIKLQSGDRAKFSAAAAANKKIRITGALNDKAYFSQKGFSDKDYKESPVFVDEAPKPNAAPTASNVQIAGTAKVDQTLTGSYTYADSENDAEGTSTFKWYQVNGSTETAIAGATSKTYVVQQADVGKTLKFEVTSIAIGGTTNGTAVRSLASAIVEAAPAPNAAPTASNVQVAGTATVGQTLTGSYNYADAESDAEGTSTFKWYQVNGSMETAIAGATSKTYVVQQADVGKTLKFEVTPIASGGTTNGTAVRSSASAIVEATPAPNAAPTASNVQVVGTATVGQTLTGSYNYADAENDAEGSSTYKWYQVNGATETAIAGATSTTYVVQQADVGLTLKFEVTPIASGGTTNGTAVKSAASAVVAAAVVPNTAPTASNVQVAGTAIVGQTLTGSYTYADADTDAEGTSTFKWYQVNGATETAIVGATSTTYVVKQADVGKTLKFEVTPIASSGTTNGTAVKSSASAVVVNTVAQALSLIGTLVTVEGYIQTVEGNGTSPNYGIFLADSVGNASTNTNALIVKLKTGTDQATYNKTAAGSRKVRITGTSAVSAYMGLKGFATYATIEFVN